ncbi:MAG: hypothetical protein GY772_29610 [bacterium]|nr:hypothetical protein [bacterium]
MLARNCVVGENREFVLPLQDLNGSGRALYKGHSEAYRALNEGLKALAQVRPHGRDYQYADGGVALRAAQAQHRALEAGVQAAMDALAAVARDYSRQGD